MQYIRITSENIDSEHICCAMSGKQSVAKKAWLKERFAEGLVFYRSEERGKCFIEYIPAENAWVPIVAPGYLYINCLWIAGSMKGHHSLRRSAHNTAEIHLTPYFYRRYRGAHRRPISI